MGTTAPTCPDAKALRMALGLSDYLDSFASEIGGETFRSWDAGPDFRAVFLDLAGQDTSELHVNLDGLQLRGGPMASVQRAAAGIGGNTDWELFQIRSNPAWWPRCRFYDDGNLVANPLAGGA